MHLKVYSILLLIDVEYTTEKNKLLQQHLASTCFNLEKTRLTFSGDYTLIVSKAYFISFKYQNINYNQSQFKTKR